jgi:hypothetical protein
MVEELDGFGVQREIVLGVVKEELQGSERRVRRVSMSKHACAQANKYARQRRITWSVLSLSLSDKLLRKEM